MPTARGNGGGARRLAGDEEKFEERELVAWCVYGFFVVIALEGIVAVGIAVVFVESFSCGLAGGAPALSLLTVGVVMDRANEMLRLPLMNEVY